MDFYSHPTFMSLQMICQGTIANPWRQTGLNDRFRENCCIAEFSLLQVRA